MGRLCEGRRALFTPLCDSVDGLMGWEEAICFSFYSTC